MNKNNLELKHFCPDFSKIKNVLKSMGAKKETVKKQKDYFFNLPLAQKKKTGRLKLRVENGKKILVYYERENFKVAEATPSTVRLYDVKDQALLKFLQDALGVVAIVEKKREVWIKRNTVFHLDTVKDVGNIFEIELQKKEKITKKDKTTFVSYQKKLLPHLGKLIRGSNIDLVTSKKK